ncbi:MAG: chemotaxis protein CheA [Spirochaetes bacterium]|nr:chemotaxis protein CheA [Spirochaetota bacterium]
MSDFLDEGLLKDFFDEAYVQIDIMEENLLVLEKNSKDKNAIDAIFRAAHTLKGNSASVSMEEITTITHTLEDAMDQIRNNEIKLNSKIIDILLSTLDIIKNMVNSRNNGTVYKKNYSKVLNNLKSLGNAKAKDKETKKGEKSEETSPDEENILKNPKFKLSEYDIIELNDANHDRLPLYKVLIVLDETNPMRTVGGIQIFTSLREISTVLKTVPEFEEIYSDAFHKEIMYIIASKLNIEDIRDYATIPDATEKVIIMPLDDKNLKISSEIKKKDSISKPHDTIEEKIEDIKKDIIENVKKNIKEELNGDESEDDEINNLIEEQKTKYIEEKFSQKEKEEIKELKTSSILRVDSQKIDILLNLVSEIVINKSSYNQISNQLNDLLENSYLTNNEYKDNLKEIFDKIPYILESDKNELKIEELKAEFQQYFKNLNNKFDNIVNQLKSIITKYKSNNINLDRISSSLQEGVMHVRMVPIQQIFSRFPRMIRDLCRDLNKDIQLNIQGEDTEIDKAMIDFLMDPLIHIVRNAIDHGIERNDERKKINKPIPANLELSAVSQGNIINISISDDGKGIDLEKIKNRAIEKGIIDKDTALKDQDAYNLLFEPGFSTADKVTSISGRGVGLDVVRKNIEKLNGTIKVNSELGMGTIFTINIPLTLAIIQGLLVKVYNEIYSIPISSVLESIRIKKDEIKLIDNYEVVNIRNEVLSLLRINRLFKSGEDIKNDYYFVVIVGTQDKKIALLVDSIVGEEDIVIKPLKDKYTNTPGISGATILGDGTVSLILDITQLIELGLKIEEEARTKK